MRDRLTPQADPYVAVSVLIPLADSKTFYEAARHLLDDVEWRSCDPVLCREILRCFEPLPAHAEAHWLRA